MQIGEQIRCLRKKRGITQKALAEALFVTPQAISQWERSITVPDTDKLPEIAKALHTSVNALTDDVASAPDWTMRDSLFSAEHMYSRMTVFAEIEQLPDTQKALYFIKDAHRGQIRKPTFFSKTPIPYITHPLLMACHAHALGIREDAILATILLHDVCEDCGVDAADLPCSDDVKEAVRLLTYAEDPALGKTVSKKRYYDAIEQNRIACIAKILDRCNNISTMASAFSHKKLVSYINETETLVMPFLESARKTIPEYVDAVFIIKYHMRSILESLKAMVLKGNA